MNRIDAWFDGVCEPRNPGGHAAYGALVLVNGEIVLSEGKHVGYGAKMSNNVAEYAGCIAVMEQIINIPGIALIRGDSNLVIQQLCGNWKVRTPDGLYVPYYRKAKRLCEELRDRVAFEWVPRTKNAACDELSKGVLRRMGVEFRIQPEPTKTYA